MHVGSGMIVGMQATGLPAGGILAVGDVDTHYLPKKYAYLYINQRIKSAFLPLFCQFLTNR